MDYQADADKIYWKSDWYNYILDRKSLLLIISDINDFKSLLLGTFLKLNRSLDADTLLVLLLLNQNIISY